MKKFWYHRQNGKQVSIECDAAFWNGVAAVFVKDASACAVISPLPGEMIVDEAIAKEWDLSASLKTADSQSPS